VYCTGNNSSGQLGDGSYENSRWPVALDTTLRFEQLVTGAEHSCALTAEGDAYCWGQNLHGQLGVGFYSASEPSPVPVAGDVVFETLSVSSAHTCGLTFAGEAYCWGSNNNGQLGIGEVSKGYTEPVPVAGEISFFEISAGARHTCGLSVTGDAYCWGYNATGALGTGEYSYIEESPVMVVSDLPFATIDAGMGFSCGVTVEGGGYCWGSNAFGQLGLGHYEPTNTPTAVVEVPQLAGIELGDHHVCATVKGGDTWCWGYNLYGTVGDGTIEREPPYGKPLPVSPDGAYCSVAASAMHTCAMTTCGWIYCWGHNGHGAFGDGTVAHSAVPTPSMLVW
jgi:alpha-tubulin suppressor-like RCC1 family protein